MWGEHRAVSKGLAAPLEGNLCHRFFQELLFNGLWKAAPSTPHPLQSSPPQAGLQEGADAKRESVALKVQRPLRDIKGHRELQAAETLGQATSCS